MRYGLSWMIALALAVPMGTATAQPPTPTEPAPAEDEAEAPPPVDTESPADAAPTPPPAAPSTPTAPSAPAPVLVVPLPAAEFDANQATTIAEAVRAGVASAVLGRELRVSAPPSDAVAAILACDNPACVGSVLQRAGTASLVLLVRLAQTGRQPVKLKVEAVDPITGLPRGEAVELDVPLASLADAAVLGEQVSGAVAPLRSLMPPEPIRPRVLVAVNADGAQVSMDGNEMGQTPIGAFETTPGNHTLSINHPGYRPFSRSLEVPEEGTRLDVFLDLDPEAMARLQEQDARDAAGFAVADSGEVPIHKQWWFWTAVGGGVLLITLTAVIIAVTRDRQEGFEVPSIPVVQ